MGVKSAALAGLIMGFVTANVLNGAHWGDPRSPGETNTVS
jgi:hypothetical protein